MPRSFPRLSLRLALLSLLLPVAAALGQTPPEGMDAIDAQYRKHRMLIGQLLKGGVEADPKDKDHAEAVDALAKYATIRFLSDLDQKTPGKMDLLYQDFDRNVASILRLKDRGKPLAQMYTAGIITHAKQVLRDGRPIAQVNVARVLARLADLEQGELADALVEVLKDANPKLNDAVRYYALRGLRNLLALPPRPAPEAPALSKAQEDKAVAAVLEFLARKPPAFAQGAPRSEVDGYRLLRREAVRALAQGHNPAGGGGRPALVLLRFVGRDAAVVPEPRLDERLEAAVGVARMQSAKDYQPDYAAYVVGRFVVDFLNAANGNQNARPAEKERPWKIDAARLIEALEAMKADTKDKYVGDLVGQALPQLASIEAGRQADANRLTTWLDGHEPPHKELFKDVPDSVVKPAAGE